MAKLTKAQIKPHEMMALEFLSRGPDHIREIIDDNTLAAALTYTNLQKLGLVVIDSDDDLLATITPAGRAALKEQA